MLNRLPTQTPPLADMLADLGGPSAPDLARALDVHPRTVARWLADDQAPRTACLSVWWLTRWGFSAVDCELWNAAQLAFSERDAWRSEVASLRRELARVVALGDFGRAANDPTRMQLPLIPVRVSR
jgi:hypothetical protein